MPKTTIWTSDAHGQPLPDGTTEHDSVLGRDYIWRPDMADAAVAWFPKYLRHTKGQQAGRPFTLADWQAEWVRALAGWRVRGHENVNRYTRAFLAVPRYNGKSMLAAGLGLRALLGEHIPAAWVIGAATDRKAAGIVYGYASQMVRAHGDLFARLKPVDSQKELRGRQSTRLYQVVSSESKRAHGFHPNWVLFDELHTQPNRNLYDVLNTSQRGLPSSMMMSITTAGLDRESLCWDLWGRALEACQDRSIAPSLLAAIYAAEENDDIEDPAVWVKSNPGLCTCDVPEDCGLHSVLPVKMKQEIAEAKRSQFEMNTLMQLGFNVWADAAGRAINMREWDQNAGAVNEEALAGKVCDAGLDYAEVDDLTALALVFQPDDGDPKDDGLYPVVMRFYLPGSALAKREAYRVWRDKGLLTITPGNATNLEFIKHDLLALAGKFRIRKVAYDRWGIKRFAQELADEGFEMVEHGQGFGGSSSRKGQGYYGMNWPTKEMMRLMLAHRLQHGGHQVLRWNAANLVFIRDPAGNVKPDKSKSADKIDGMVALIMAVGQARDIREEPPQVYMVSA